jgi:N-acetylglucosaminyl-diphospho-decaprenol L-rhamnosyltransferase
VIGDPWTVVTVTYNSAEQLQRCWAGQAREDVQWIVVDNASADRSADCARDLGADEVVRLDRNRGFGAANNVGMSRADCDWIMFVNPDVSIGPSADLDRLAAVSQANKDALIAPQLLNPDGSEQPNARGLPFLVDKLAHRSVPLPGARLHDYVRTGLREPTYVAWAIGAAVGGRLDVLRALGGWDERYVIYYEDHDLGLRAWQHDVPVVVDPTIRWRHEWQRETTRLRLGPWAHEVRSAGIFYATYPALLFPRRRRSLPEGLLKGRLWREANDARGSCRD